MQLVVTHISKYRKIFCNILAHNKRQDVKLQKLHKFLLKTTYCIAKTLDSILTSSSKPDQTLMNNIKELAFDALTELRQSYQQLLQQTQDVITGNVGCTKPLTKRSRRFKAAIS